MSEKRKEYFMYFQNEAAELDNLAAEDLVAYSQSYAKMVADERAMEYACAQSFSKGESVGFSKGELEGFRKTAVKLKGLGFDTETISKATGLTLEEIEKL